MGSFRRKSPVDSNQVTREYFDEILIEMRHIDGALPDTSFELYGKTFKTPIMMAALSHIKGKNGQGDGLVQMAESAMMSSSVNWMGMSTNEQFADVAKVGAPTIRIIKPYADESEIIKRIDLAEELGALAIGMDLDHSFNSKGQYDNIEGLAMSPKSLQQIQEYCSRTKLPFIIKGVISGLDAQKCLEAGVGGIVVSHHSGISPSILPPLMALGEIVKVIDNQIPIFVDCGIMNGIDAFKALAMGASAVCVGRPVMHAITENGSQGGADTINTITEELAGIMARTCSPSLDKIDPSLLWNRNGGHRYEKI